jgi:hypothetical protein
LRLCRNERENHVINNAIAAIRRIPRVAILRD